VKVGSILYMFFTLIPRQHHRVITVMPDTRVSCLSKLYRTNLESAYVVYRQVWSELIIREVGTESLTRLS
jgi:hypothetical protein